MVAIIITFILVGRWFESRARSRAGEALRTLAALGATQARLVDPSDPEGPERLVAVEAVKPGDVFLVRPGDKVPVDGVVISGQSSLDELLGARDKINERLREIIDRQTEPWGVKVGSVELKDAQLAESMVRALARQAEAFADRLLKESPTDPAAAAVRLAFARPARPEELVRLNKFLIEQAARHAPAADAKRRAHPLAGPKLATARFFAEHELARAPGFVTGIKGGGTVIDFDPDTL